MRMKSTIMCVATVLITAAANAQVFNFEYEMLPEANTDYTQTVDTGNYYLTDWSGSEFYGRKESWGGFSGFTYSNVQDSVTPGFENDRAAFPAIGALGSSQYGVCYGAESGALIRRYESMRPTYQAAVFGMYVTNATYAVKSMENGDGFAKKFGGADGTDPDWLLLTIKGYNFSTGITDSVEFYLADFRSDDPSEDYIVKDWRYINLESLDAVDSLSFSLTSSDIGEFGMNTPAYFCLDEIGIEVGPNSISEVNNKLAVNLFPNPTINGLYIEGVPGINYNAKVADISGKLLKIAVVTNYISIADLPSGIYMVYLEDKKSGKNKVQKIIKQ